MRSPGPIFAGTALLIALVTGWLYNISFSFKTDGPALVLLKQSQGSGQNLNYFIRRKETDGSLLTYGWKDLKGKTHYADFFLSDEDVEAAEEEFGYYPEQLRGTLDANGELLRMDMISRLNDLAVVLIKKSPYAGKIFMDRSDPLSINIKISASPTEYEKVKAEFTRITGIIAAEQQVCLEEIEAEYETFRSRYLEDRGIRVIENKIAVDYSMIIKKNRDRMRRVFESIRKSAGSRVSLHGFLGLLTAFIQEIRYGIPPREEEGKMILEFWPPTKVLINNLGDCDSKGAAFAAVWTNYKRYPLVLIKIPNHMLLGIAVPARRGDGFVLNGLRFTLLEVTGPNKIPPGMITQYSQMHLSGGKYDYESLR